jgi:hypothetical protein
VKSDLTAAEQAGMGEWNLACSKGFVSGDPRRVLAALQVAAAEHKAVVAAVVAAVVREVVELATNPSGPSPEWMDLVMAVGEGHYTPPSRRDDHV